MAKKSKIVREYKIIKNVQKYASIRSDLKNLIKSPQVSTEEKRAAVAKLDKLPKSSSRTRIRTRCFKTGRPRGVIKRFNLSRIAIRDMAGKGQIPGLTKASW